MTPRKTINRYCLVTGASHGIGKAISYELASRGFSILAVSNDKNSLDKLQEGIESKYNIRCITLEKDLLNPDKPKEIFDWCMINKIDVQILVNNVGVGASGSFEDTDIRFDLDLIKLNLFPMIQLTKLFLPELKKFDKSYVKYE